MGCLQECAVTKVVKCTELTEASVEEIPSLAKVCITKEWKDFGEISLIPA